MRTRLLASEAALADYEILEMLLFLGIARRDTKPLAKALINRFGSLSRTLQAGAEALAQAGLPRPAIAALHLVAEAAGYLAQPERVERTVLSNLGALERHLQIGRRSREAPGISALLLNNRNELLAEPSWPAEIGPEALVREMLRQALDQHATAAILVRNRADRAPQVGPEDRALHASAQRAAAALSVAVHDLVVVGGGDWVSLRQRDGR